MLDLGNKSLQKLNNDHMSIEAGTQTDISDMTGDEKEGTLSTQLTEVPLYSDNANNGPTTIDTHATQVCAHIIETSFILDSHTNCNEVLQHEESGSTHANGNDEDRNSKKRKCVYDDNKDTYRTGEVIVPISKEDENVVNNLSQQSTDP